MRKYTTITIVALCCVTAATAATVFAPNGLPRPYPFDGPDDLVMFDSSDPAGFVTVGSMNVPNIGFGGMEFDDQGNLWAYASTYKNTGGAASGLYSVNIFGGQATPQGTLSTQPLDDLAFNPADSTMYGVRTQGFSVRLYSVDLVTGGTSLVGTFTGLNTQPQVNGVAFDSQGNVFLHEQLEDKIYKGTGLAVSELYALAQDTAFSQGIAVDWSRNDKGYHGAVGRGEFPNYFSQLNTFATDGSGYVEGPAFGPNEFFPGDQFGYPPIQPGDVAIMPVPEPASVFLFALIGLVRRR
jgi:hypothetical protein